jgi:hypothetical protein
MGLNYNHLFDSAFFNAEFGFKWDQKQPQTGKEIQTCNEHGISTICAQQEINEHIFVTIKRQWDYNHTNLRSLKKVNGEFALIMTVYNMKRSMNVLGMETILEKIKNWKPNYKGMTLYLQKPSCFRVISAHQNIEMKLAA